MREKHSLDPFRVVRRSIPAHGSIIIDLPFPPGTREATSAGQASRVHEEWRNGAAEAIAAQRPRCASGPVEICVTLEDRQDFRAFDNLARNILELLVGHRVITSANSGIVRRLTLEWTNARRGARVEISALPIARAA